MRVSRSLNRPGLTLIEVLIATTLTLMLMLALAQGFKALSDSVSEGRTKLSLSDQLRGISSILRADLERATVSRQVMPSSPGPGYFKYYDGPMWDSTGLYSNFSEGPLRGSRWGDIDDVLMFTARSYPGEVFRGTVPQALMIISQLNQFAKQGIPHTDSIASNYIASVQSAVSSGTAWTTEVSIESDLAEIIWFMMPMAEGNRLPVPAGAGSYIDPTVNSVVIDEAFVDGMPDNVALCRRELPIRPDIDLNPFNPNATYQGVITALLTHTLAPRISVNAGSPASFRTAMHQFYQRCDLSLKPHKWEATGSGFQLSVKANSLEELQLPENRFAHFTYPVPTSVGIPVASSTLPILALTDESAGSGRYRLATDGLYSASGLNTINVSNRGFIMPCFMRARFDGTPMLTEVVATNVVAFDAKIFDATAMQIAHPGNDGGPGDAFSSGGAPELGVAGLPGTDDLAVSPSDPGYAALLATAAIPPPQNIVPPTVLAQGAFVDMGWGWRLQTNLFVDMIPNPKKAVLKDYFMGQASGIYEFTTNFVPEPALPRSGTFYNNSSLSILQFNYDTYTDYYDHDGERLDENANGERFYRGGLRRFNIPVAMGLPDDFYDGVRNTNQFKDAVPPAPFDVSAVKVTIRVQDITAGILQQMSVIQSFDQ